MKIINRPCFMATIILMISSITNAQNVGIGTPTPLTPLHIKGAANLAELTIDRAPGQSVSTPILKLRDASGFDLFWINTTDASSMYIGVNAGLTYDGFFTPSRNTIVGTEAAMNGSGGFNLTAVGYRAAYSGMGSYNTAIGQAAMYSSTTSQQNTAVGSSCMYRNVSGDFNTSMGEQAMYGNINGSYNVGLGWRALQLTTNSQYNTCVGYMAGGDRDYGYNNVFAGANTGANGTGYYNVVAVGQATVITASNQIRLGNSATSSTGGWTGWSNISDGRFKKDVQENVPGLDFILKLHPVTYHLDITKLHKELGEFSDPETDSIMNTAIAAKEKMMQSGFVAQDVEKAATELGYDFSGVDKPKNEKDFYGLRYAEFVVPLVKAVQEQQQQIKSLQEQNKEMKKIIDELKKR